ncbi:ABC transporter permease [Caldicellulosiruptor morganii]|uniref:ABC transporter permease n=1 Tax=Caldicellulosiruptor morganii TaxID=1387555 RepID=A0ABY7BNL8_9FIRM|nr:ABC transporter permease [Caldicellulosiruptor morganii]WAM33126.1 ABC transporter permease [Caldicellulosiruptor morganii]
MNKIVALATRDFFYTIKSKGFLISVFLAMFYISLWLIYKPKFFVLEDYQYELFRFIQFIFIYLSSMLLGKEFKYRTSTVLFTGVFTRTEIILEKMLVMLQLSFLLWLISRLLNPLISLRINSTLKLSEIWKIKDLNALVIYLCVAFLICVFALFISVISFNHITTIFSVLTLFGFIQYISLYPTFKIHSKILSGNNLSTAERIFTYFPNYIIGIWSGTWKFEKNELFLMLLYGLIFLVFSIVILNKRDIR